MALVQLLGYRRHIEPRPSLAILVPSRPRQDLLNLCADVEATVIEPDGNDYASTAT